MKELKTKKFSSLFVGLLGLTVTFSPVLAQEYDDMYFNKSDRKTAKVENKAASNLESKNFNNVNYNQATKSTEVYSAKNVNPEYIARYKNPESNEVQEQTVRNNEYSSDDYFIENYNVPDSAIGSHVNDIDYAALNKRDQMSYSSYNNGYSNYRSSWGLNPYMRMGYGNPYYYDPFMSGYGSGMSMALGFGFGSGFYPSMSYNVGMSWGTGYNPWGGWGGYSSYYNPYRMSGFYDPWGMSYGSRFSPYYGGMGYGSYAYGYGYSRPVYLITSSSDYDNGRNISYKPRTSRSSTTTNVSRRNSELTRTASTNSNIRVPSRTTTASNANGRVSRDYSKSQNEYFNSSRAQSSSATQRITRSNTSSRSAYNRSAGATSTRQYSSMSGNRPSRVSNSSSSSYNRSSTRSSSYTSPSRNSSSFNRSSSFSSGSSSGRSSSYSSGSSRSSSSSSGSRSSSSGSSRSGRQ